jgi:hypothetical protein
MPCSHCHEDGHNIRTCPVRRQGLIVRIQRDLRDESDQIIRILTLPGIPPTRREILMNTLSQEELDRLTARMVDVAIPDPPPPTNKKPMRKEIADAFFVCSEETVECCICQDEVKQDSFRLSRCGHNYCEECYENNLLTKCALCREENM